MKSKTVIGCLLSIMTPAAFSQPIVVATPTTGELGSVIHLSVVPQTQGYELTSETVGIWFGNYGSSAGTSPFFTTTYEDANIIIVDDWTAQIVLGSGEYVSKGGPIDFATLATIGPNGTLNGTFQLITPQVCEPDLSGDGVLNFFDVSAFLVAYSNEDPQADFSGDGMFNFFDVSTFLVLFNQGCGPSVVTSQGPVSLDFNTDPADWYHIHYPGGWGIGGDPILLVEEANDLDILTTSGPGSPPTDDTVLGAEGVIYAIVLDVEQNPVTVAGHPSEIYVDVFTVDSAGNEVDRVSALRLENSGVVNGRVRFSSLLDKNILMTDSSVDDSGYSGVRTLMSENNGQAFVVLHIGG